jgi:hypothetical protein
MDLLSLARVHAAGRVAMGAALMLAPARIGGAWVGRLGRRPQAQVVTTALGARDVGIGAGALLALAQGSGARPWIAAGALADAADVAATLRGRGSLPPLAVAGVSVLAAGSVAFGLRALRAAP